MKGLRLTSIKAEGRPAHPDIFHNSDEMSDEYYLKQLQAYHDEVEDAIERLIGLHGKDSIRD